MSQESEPRNSSQGSTRREFMKTVALATGAAGALTAYGRAVAAPVAIDAGRGASTSEGLSLSAAGYRLRRLEALFDGRVKIEGCDARFEKMAIGDMNTNVFSGPQTLDVTEIGLHPFMLAYANDGFRTYTLLPIFPLRAFRHRSVFIRNDRGIKRPEDLKGRKIATPGYSSTSLTWIRGIFEDEYGISPKDVQWIVAAKRGRIKAMAEGPARDKAEAFEKAKAQIRSIVEHPFHVVKNRFGLRKVRYRGLAKNTAQLFSLFALSNLVISKRRLLAQG